MKLIVRIYSRLKPQAYSLAGSFFISSGWLWYHYSHHPRVRIIIVTLITTALIFASYKLFKHFFGHLAIRFHRHPFWPAEFKNFLDKLFFVFSLLFLVFFSHSEILSFIYVSAVLLLLFYALHSALRKHPAATPWLAVNRSVFILGYFIFIFSGIAQYAARRFFIFDVGAKFYDIVIFRAVAMTAFWLLGFAAAGFIYWTLKSIWRYVALVFWSLSFVFCLVFWVANIGVLYFSGLYLSPFMLTQAEGGGGVIWNWLTWVLLALFAVFLAFFIYTLRETARAHRLAPKRYWHFYNISIAAFAVLALLGISSFKNTPEYITARSFYRYFVGVEAQTVLNPIIQKKLERFGLFYNTANFKLAHKAEAYSSPRILLPDRLNSDKPNIIIVFLESFSARLTGPYNSRWKNLTPGLNNFVSDRNTTLFKNFYNASTPTVTGLIAQLCSILPPTGHNEIEQDKKLQSHRLLCLPEILRRNGYSYAAYITAVEKNFANKGGIFAAAGADEVFGIEELKKYITGEPMSWGYSDHQMFPLLLKFAEEKSKDGKFFLMLSTVDTHPPFTKTKDIVQYGQSKSNFLNTLHTTDDAFSKFWEDFKTSRFYDNTIVIAVADHAVFPAAYDKVVFPEERKTANFYDELFFGMYIPDSILPKTVDVYSSSIDLAPTVMQILHVNSANSFEGHSIFDDREKYPNLLGMHEFGLYTNQVRENSARAADFGIPAELDCPADAAASSTAPFSLCEFLEYYHWKRRMFEEGRFWEK